MFCEESILNASVVPVENAISPLPDFALIVCNAPFEVADEEENSKALPLFASSPPATK